MPRQLQDSFGHVRPLSVITPIARGGTGADTAPQAVINLQGIPRTKIDVPLGVAGADHDGYLMRKYLENVGIFSRITLEGPNVVARSTASHTNHPAFFISNYDTKNPPVISASDPAVQASLVVAAPLFYFTAPETGDSITLTINSRDYVITLTDDAVLKPSILVKPDSQKPSFFLVESSKFRSLGMTDIHTSASWTDLLSGKTELILDNQSHTLIVQGWCGESGTMSVFDGEETYTFPKSQVRFPFPVTKTGRISIVNQGALAASYALASNTLDHTASDWQIATDEAFSQLVMDNLNDVVNLAALPVNLTPGSYYIRVRHHDTAANKVSPWSDAVRFAVSTELDVLDEKGIVIDQSPSPTSGFGSAVAVHGNLVAVGEEFDNTSAPKAGSVVIYRKNGYLHEYVTRIISPTDTALGQFGAAVAFAPNGDLYIGAPGITTDVSKGTVYRYSFLEELPVYQEEIKGRPSSLSFGYALHCTGDLLFVGDPSDGVNGHNAGAVQVHSVKNNVHTYLKAIWPSTPAAEDHFGVSITATANGGHLFVGAVSPVILDNAFGKVYVMGTVDNLNWLEMTMRDSPMPMAGARFGRSLAYSNTTKTLYVGCEGDNDKGASAGAVFAFGCELGELAVLTYTVKHTPTTGVNQGMYGSSLACTLDGYQLYVGSRGYKLNGVDIGAVYYLT